MTPSKKLEDLVRSARVTTSAATDERISAAVEAVKAKRNEQSDAEVCTGGRKRRITMKSNWIKLATAAAVIAAIGLGMYALIGPGTSITMAQVRQAMQEIDWIQMICKVDDKDAMGWYSFASKVQILVDPEGKITYHDFNAGKRLVWNPGSEDIYESDIDKDKQFAGGVTNLYEGLTKSMTSWEAEGNYKVTRENGTYLGRKVEIWTARRMKGEPKLTRTETATFYIDLEKKLLLNATDVKGAYGDVQTTNVVEFKYPETGPADIYEAGAPRSAQIKPAPEQ